jgi:cytidylate kinase
MKILCASFWRYNVDHLLRTGGVEAGQNVVVEHRLYIFIVVESACVVFLILCGLWYGTLRMLSEKEKSCLKDVLQSIPKEEVNLLVQTVTSNVTVTTTVEGK